MFILEGNVGVGKSTLLQLIEKNLPHIEIVSEPIAAWHTEDHSKSLLSLFYKDIHRWSYTMETWTMLFRVQEHRREQQSINTLKIMERSIYSGYYCFARNGFLQGYMSEIEWAACQQWFNFLVNNHCKIPKGFIYLQSDPIICYHRTRQRARNGEEAIPISYFQQIHEQHEQFLIHKHDLLPGLATVPTLVLPASEDFVNNQKRRHSFLEQIEAFVQEQTLINSPVSIFEQKAISTHSQEGDRPSL